MAIAIKSIPTLEGSAANDFYTKAIEKGEKMPLPLTFRTSKVNE